MNFAPYQDDAPESGRTSTEVSTSRAPALPYTAPKPSTRTPAPPTTSYADTPEDDEDFLPDPEDFDGAPVNSNAASNINIYTGAGARVLGFGGRRGGADIEGGLDVGGRGGSGDMYATSLGLRMDVEAALAYLVFPPAAGAALLVGETRSDYVR